MLSPPLSPIVKHCCCCTHSETTTVSTWFKQQYQGDCLLVSRREHLIEADLKVDSSLAPVHEREIHLITFCKWMKTANGKLMLTQYTGTAYLWTHNEDFGIQQLV